MIFWRRIFGAIFNKSINKETGMFKKQDSIKTALRAVAAAAILGSASVGAMACGSEPFVGEVCTFAFNYCPNTFVPADGRLLPISQYQVLFALLSNSYGGDARTNFAVPDLRNRTAVQWGTSPDTGMTLQFAQKVGAVLTSGNLPAHTHPVVVPANAIGGAVSLPVSGSVANQSVAGSVTVNALNTGNPPTGAASNVPSATNNTIGKAGALMPFYPATGNTLVGVPTDLNLTVSGGNVAGTAAGTVTLPTSPTALATGANATSSAGVIPPRLAMSVCIATMGIFPSRD
jgi:microcystin-dependent protein